MARGHRVRVYTPYGAMLPGMAYLVRRLLENTSNESFLKASLSRAGQHRRPAAQPRGDRSHAQPHPAAQAPAAGPAAELPPFRNEPVDRLRPRREPPGHGPGHRGRPRNGSASLIPLLIEGRGGQHRRPRRSTRSTPATARGSSAGSPWPAPSTPRPPSRPREGAAGLGGDARPRTGRGPDQGRRHHARGAGSSWPPGRSSSAASPGARPTPTSPRRSTSASSTPAR